MAAVAVRKTPFRSHLCKNGPFYQDRLGTNTGKTFLKTISAGPIVHGFDSFRGLPEDWAGRDGMKKGTFDVNGRKPTVPDNVVLHPGWFNETLPKFILEQLVLVEREDEEQQGEEDDEEQGEEDDEEALAEADVEGAGERAAAGGAGGGGGGGGGAGGGAVVSYVHVDCNLFPSVYESLALLSPWFVKGTVLLFDDWFFHDGWEQGESKAWQQLAAERGIGAEKLPLIVCSSIFLTYVLSLSWQIFVS